MTTLIAVHNSNGLVGRCDAKCYNAHHSKCVCVCGGMNHGCGLEKAQENTAESAEAMVKAYAEQHDLTDYTAVVPPIQLPLPGLSPVIDS